MPASARCRRATGFFASDPTAMTEVARQVKQPCLGFKILAAGRKCDNTQAVQEAFKFAFEHLKPIDGVIVGMYPRQRIRFRKTLPSQGNSAQKRTRERFHRPRGEVITTVMIHITPWVVGGLISPEPENRRGTTMARALLLCIGLCLVPLQTQAAEFYVDPVNGSPAGDGSASRPWRTIQEVFDAGRVESQQWDKLPYTPQSKLVAKNAGIPVRAGDTIWLRSGYHGDLLIDKYYNLGRSPWRPRKAIRRGCPPCTSGPARTGRSAD